MFKKVTEIGLEIGSKKIKLVKIKHKKNSIEIVKFASITISPGLVEGGLIKDTERLGMEIGVMVKELNLQGKGVISSVSGQQLYTRSIEMPRMNLVELKDAALYQATKFLPIPVDEAAIDIFPLRNYEDEDGKKTEVFFVAVRQQQVDNLVEVCNYAGLKLMAVDIDPLAIYRILDFNAEFVADTTVAFLYMENSYSSITVFRNDVMIFNRFLSIGLENFIAQKNVFEPDLDHDFIDANSDSFNYLIQDMTNDILRSLEYYNLQFQDNIEQLYFVGEGITIQGLAEKFSSALERKILVADTMSKLILPSAISDIQARELQCEFTVALGLAAREVY